MELAAFILLHLMLKTCHPSPINEIAAAGEIWTNQTDLEVVNGTNIRNLLQQCEGCIINIKSVPSPPTAIAANDAAVGTGNNDNTQQKHVVNTEGSTSDEATIEAASLKDEKDVLVDHTSELSELLNNCSGCFLDYHPKPRIHKKDDMDLDFNLKDIKFNLKDKKKKKMTKKERRRQRRRKRKEKEKKEAAGMDVMNTNRAIQPPDAPETPGNIPYKDANEPSLDEVPPLDNVAQRNPDKKLAEINNDIVLSNSPNAPNIPSDEQMDSNWQANYTQSPLEVKSQTSGETRQDASLVVDTSQENASSGGNILNITDSEIRTPNDVFKVQPAGPITIEINPNTEDANLIDYVCPQELKKLLKRKDVRLIDLRETWEINHSGKILDSVHIALNSLGLALKLTENKFKSKYGINKPESDDCNLVFMDSSGERSDIAYKYAREHGYQCPRSLQGGFDSWRTQLGVDASTYDEMPKANMTTINVNAAPSPQYEMKKNNINYR